MIAINSKHAAQLLRLKMTTIQRYCANGTFPNAYKDGRSWLIPTDDIEAYREQQVVARIVRGCPCCGILTDDNGMCDDCRRERAGGGYRWYEINLYGAGLRRGGVRL